jgi:hypothetical protein
MHSNNIDYVLEYYSECPACGQFLSDAGECYCSKKLSEKDNKDSYEDGLICKLELLLGSVGADNIDYILAKYMLNSLRNFEEAASSRDRWHGFWYPEHDMF